MEIDEYNVLDKETIFSISVKSHQVFTKYNII